MNGGAEKFLIINKRIQEFIISEHLFDKKTLRLFIRLYIIFNTKNKFEEINP